jgi:hypothetical protein
MNIKVMTNIEIFQSVYSEVDAQTQNSRHKMRETQIEKLRMMMMLIKTCYRASLKV